MGTEGRPPSGDSRGSWARRGRGGEDGFWGDFLQTGASNALVTALGAAGGVLAARVLGPEGRGELAIAVVWAGLLGGVAQLGIPQAIAYWTAREPDAAGSICRTALILWLVQSVVITLVGVIAIFLVLSPTQPASVPSVLVYLASVPCVLLTFYVVTLAQGLKLFALFNLPRIASQTGYALCMALAGVLGLRQVRETVMLLLLAHIIVTAGSVWACIRSIQTAGRFERGRMRQLLSYGLRAYWWNLSWLANARLDQFIMGALVSMVDLGRYAVAASYAMILYPLSTTLAMVLFPRVVGSGAERGVRTIERGLKVNFLALTACCFVLIAVSPTVLPLVFGGGYSSAVLPAMILTAGTVLLGSNYVLSDGLRALGAPMDSSIAEAVGCVVTVVGLAIVLPHTGIVGAAWVSVASYGSVFVVLLFCFRRRRDEVRPASRTDD